MHGCHLLFVKDVITRQGNGLAQSFCVPTGAFFLNRAIFTCVGAFRTRHIVSVNGSRALTQSMAGVTLTVVKRSIAVHTGDATTVDAISVGSGVCRNCFLRASTSSLYTSALFRCRAFCCLLKGIRTTKLKVNETRISSIRYTIY